MKSMAQQLEVFIFIVDLNKNDDEETEVRLMPGKR
jgi:hypothetical protein